MFRKQERANKIRFRFLKNNGCCVVIKIIYGVTSVTQKAILIPREENKMPELLFSMWDLDYSKISIYDRKQAKKSSVVVCMLASLPSAFHFSLI